MQTLVLILDLGGTFAFALSGAVAGVRKRLDVYGVLVVAFTASTFGGISRDVLIGAVPPAALSDWRYLAVSLAAGLIVFFWSSIITRLRGHILELPTIVCAVIGGVVCFSIRIAALRRAWQLPVAAVHDPSTYPDEQ